MPFPINFADKLTIGLSIITADGTTNLNDHVAYAISANNTREQVSTQYNQIKATSPVLAGEYLLHSVPQMVTETVQIWAFGSSHSLLEARLVALKAAFEHMTYQLAWSWGDYSEHWNCNAVSAMSSDRGQVMLHNYMGSMSLQVPRFPAVVTP